MSVACCTALENHGTSEWSAGDGWSYAAGVLVRITRYDVTPLATKVAAVLLFEHCLCRKMLSLVPRARRNRCVVVNCSHDAALHVRNMFVIWGCGTSDDVHTACESDGEAMIGDDGQLFWRCTTSSTKHAMPYSSTLTAVLYQYSYLFWEPHFWRTSCFDNLLFLEPLLFNARMLDVILVLPQQQNHLPKKIKIKIDTAILYLFL